MKKLYDTLYIEDKTEEIIKELIINFKHKTHNDQIKIDTLDLCHIFGYIKHLESKVSLYERIDHRDLVIRKLQINNYWLKNDNEVYKSRLNKADEYVTYLGLKCKYKLNSGHLRKLRNILRGKNNV